MSKSHSIKETKGNAVVFLKAASDNASRQLRSTSKEAELGGNDPPLSHQDQHFPNISLQMCT